MCCSSTFDVFSASQSQSSSSAGWLDVLRILLNKMLPFCVHKDQRRSTRRRGLEYFPFNNSILSSDSALSAFQIVSFSDPPRRYIWNGMELGKKGLSSKLNSNSLLFQKSEDSLDGWVLIWFDTFLLVLLYLWSLLNFSIYPSAILWDKNTARESPLDVFWSPSVSLVSFTILVSSVPVAKYT